MTPERRRLIPAVIVTVLAIPLLWASTRSGDSGATADGSVEVIVIGEPDTTDTTRPVIPSLLGDPGGAFLLRPEPVDPEAIVPTTAAPTTTTDNTPSPTAVATLPDPTDIDDTTFVPENERIGTATFRTWIGVPELCAARNIPPDTLIRVTNLRNGQVTGCRVAFISLGTNDVILDRTAFALIADLTEAPIPVEITW